MVNQISREENSVSLLLVRLVQGQQEDLEIELLNLHLVGIGLGGKIA
jgi:hypothetical protein